MSDIIDLSVPNCDFDGLLVCSGIKPAKGGSKVINVLRRSTGRPVKMNLPLMLTWGASEKEDPNTKVLLGKWYMALQFPNKEHENPDTINALNNMIAFDRWVKMQAMNHSVEWFGKQCSYEVIEDKVNEMLKYPKVAKGSSIADKTRAPTLSVNIPQYERNGSKEWVSEIYDEDYNAIFVPSIHRNESPLPYLVKFAYIASLIENAGIWIGNGKMSITWNLRQGVAQAPKQDIVPGVCQIALKPADKATIANAPTLPSSSSDDTMAVIEDDPANTEDLYAAVSAMNTLPPAPPVASTTATAPVPVATAPVEATVPTTVFTSAPTEATTASTTEVKTTKKVVASKKVVK